MADGTQSVTKLDLAKKSSDELIQLLTNRNEWYSREARLILAERQDNAILPGLIANARQSTDQRLALESLWTLYQCGGFDESLAV